MANAPKFYLDHMQETFGGYRAVWTPTSSRLNIGDIITFDSKGGIVGQSTLEKQQIPFEVRADESTSDIDRSSGTGVEITFKAEGKAPAAGSLLKDTDAGFNIQFKKDKSIVFKLSGSKTYEIVNMGEVTQAVLEKYRAGSWPKEWLIVTALVKAASGVIIISDNGNTAVDLKANAAVAAGEVKIANGNFDIAGKSGSGNVDTFTAPNGITPLYRCMGLKSSLFGKTRLDTRDISAQHEVEQLTLVEVDPDETEDSALEVDGSEI